MLDLLTVGPIFTRPACHMQPSMHGFADAACFAATVAALGRDRQTDGQTDTAPFECACCIRGPRSSEICAGGDVLTRVPLRLLQVRDDEA